ncbi:MAG TPA: hypothetical protein DEP84_10965, partial [Chloroflexi bacterium]|nr:hypothetical protein [Chloroflexota bacterium]
MTTPASTLSAELLQAVTDSLAPDAGDFVGREFVRGEIKQFLATRNRMLVIVGPPGIGKTALAAALFREQMVAQQSYVAHFCGLSGADNPFIFCDTLAEQLQAQLGEDYSLPETARRQQVIIKTTQQVTTATEGASIVGVQLGIGGMHPREAFRQLVREPLRAYDQAHGAERRNAPLVILVDALDRAWEWDSGQGGNIVSILADVQDMPPWVNFICTARPGPAVRALRAQAGVQVVDLDPKSTANLDDVRAFFRDCFLGKLAPEQYARVDELLISTGFDGGKTAEERAATFVQRATEASQGIFLFVRRYVDAWGSALATGSGAVAAEPLLRFDAGDTLAGALDASYAAIAADLRQQLDANPNDADEDVLATLAIAFDSLSVRLLGRLAGRSEDEVADSLSRLAPVLKPSGAATCALYHRGFAEYVRRQLPSQGRLRDLRAAELLEQPDSGDPSERAYGARYRWAHLLRGLDLSTAAQPVPSEGLGGPPEAARLADRLASITEVQTQVPDPLTQAQVLRWLAARALDPARADVPGSWAIALKYLEAAEGTLRRSRALVQLRQQGWRITEAGYIPPELLELERTLIARGDAYTTIARRMDAGGPQPGPDGRSISRLYNFLEAITRLPLMLYLLQVVLRLQPLREIEFPGTLENLGRDRDWTVARLYVQSVSAYRRARWLTRLHGADELSNDVNEHLARVYMLMGAYNAAARTYEALLARPATIRSPWRQAVWRLALAEVLLPLHDADRAVEVLSSAIPIFEAQQAPVQRARALSALAIAHRLQADVATARKDHALAGMLDDLTIVDFSAALEAWRNVPTLAGDEGAGVDPAMARSYTVHQLWRAGRSPRLGDDQQRQVRQLLDTIPERHYPQRFEHPVLRLFRLTATVLLPIFVLAGLLLAVQLPSKIQIGTRTDLTFQPPVLDVTGFPDNVTDVAGLSASDIAQLAPRNVMLELQTQAPALDPLAIGWIVLLALGAYLGLYTLVGLGVIARSSPAQYQDRRPGRLILGRDTLAWTGAIGEGSLQQAQAWLWQDVRTLFQRVGQWLARPAIRFPSPPHDGPIPGAPPRLAASSATVLNLTSISSVVVVNRRIFGKLLPDFSFTVLHMRRAKSRPLLIQGSVVHYEELCDELERSLNVPCRSLGVELVHGFWGLCFTLTLLYSVLLVTLLPLMPKALMRPLPVLGYSLSHLYVLATPGLILPLLWWFIAHPLGASRARASVLPMIMTGVAGFALTAAVVGGEFSLPATRLRPDLVTPILATGLLAALIVHTPDHRSRSRPAARWNHALRAGVVLLAVVGLLLLAQHIGQILRWYHDLVQGNLQVAHALSSSADACTADSDTCDAVDRAIRFYDAAICQRSRDSDGYAFRGFAHLVRGQHQQAHSNFQALRGEPYSARLHAETARDEYRLAYRDFQFALRVATLGPADLPPGCASRALSVPTPDQQGSLYANLGTVDALLARDRPLTEADQYYQQAVEDSARALGLLGPRPITVTLDSNVTGCYDLARQLLAPDGTDRSSYHLNLLADESTAALRITQVPFVLQLADTCYSWGFARERALSSLAYPNQAAARRIVWEDLAAAIAEYTAVTAATGHDTAHRLVAQRGLAAAWLALSQLEPRPDDAPTRRTCLLRTQAPYQALIDAGQRDEAIY